MGDLMLADLITTKQFSYLRDLAKNHSWTHANADVSITIKKVTRAATWSDATLAGVLRKDASTAISFLLTVASTPHLTPAPPTTTTSKWFTLSNLLVQLPISKYAVWSDADQHWVFVQVREQKSTKKRYLNKLQGAPSTWVWASGVSVDWMISMAETLLENPTKFAMNYCEKFTRCSACDSPLSNKISIAEAMGPICRKKFKW